MPLSACFFFAVVLLRGFVLSVCFFLPHVCFRFFLCDSILRYIANSVIFVLSGVIIMQNAIIDQDQESPITASDWGYLFLLYFFLIVIRGITFFIFA